MSKINVLLWVAIVVALALVCDARNRLAQSEERLRILRMDLDRVAVVIPDLLRTEILAHEKRLLEALNGRGRK